jgi:peptidyl-prolyl cis-trans isomerase D
MAAQAPKTPKATQNREPKRGIKNPAIYVGTIVVLVIVVIAFVFLPMGSGSSSISSGRSVSFGQYAGKSIDYGQGTYMAGQVQNLDEYMRQQGLTQDNYQLYAYQVYRGAFERAAIRMAVLDAVKTSGVRVTEPWLDVQITKLAQFQENGAFSAQLYQKAGFSKQMSIRNDLRDGTMYQTYYNDIMGLKSSSKERQFIKEMAKDQRTVQYAAYPLSAYPDSEVAAWGKANAALFRSLSLSRVTITASEADALKLLKNVKSGAATFEDVAKASSKDADAQKGGAMGAKYFHEIQSELAVKADADKLVALKKGELSPVLKTTAGAWAFYRADADAAEADIGKAEVVAHVRDYMTRSERGAIEDWLVAKAKELSSAGGAGFEAAAKKAGLVVKTAGPFPINFGDFSVYISEYNQSAPIFKAVEGSETPELAGAAANEKFLTAAFSLASGAVSEPLVLGDYAIVLKVKDASPAKDEDLAGVDYLYPYFYQSKFPADVRNLFMTNKKLKDNFSKTFFKYFYNPSATSSGSSKES